MKKNGIILNAYGKINLGLDVIKKLDNGYHEVCMVMQTVGVYDTITIRKQKKQGIRILADENRIPCDESNLAWKAAKILTDTYGIKEGVEMEIEKRIPVAAGMAGGSTDCAAVLKGMEELFQLNISSEKMDEIAVKLGADVPYCIRGGTVLAEGIGEKLTLLKAAPPCIILLAKPDISVSTKYVYENLNLNKIIHHPDIAGLRRAIEQQNTADMCGYMENVLETVTGKKYPIIGKIEECMREDGALCALMSGSGPTVFGVFEDKKKAELCENKIRKNGFAKEIFVTGFVQPKGGQAVG